MKFDMPPDVSDRFDPKRGAWLVNHLMTDLSITAVQAAGIVGNLAGESGVQAINERHPMVPGSRGGWSWAQWTGPRRTAFEKFCADNGFDLSSDEGAYRFLLWELRNTESKALRELRVTSTVESAVYKFEVLFERPSDPLGGLAGRVRFAHQALEAAATARPTPDRPARPPRRAPITPSPPVGFFATLRRWFGLAA